MSVRRDNVDSALFGMAEMDATQIVAGFLGRSEKRGGAYKRRVCDIDTHGSVSFRGEELGAGLPLMSEPAPLLFDGCFVWR